MATDMYGIPEGGNSGPPVVKYWKNIHYTMSWQELMATLALAGWPRELWGMAGAVVAAESSRNPFIYNTYKKGHFGLFQISRSAWPEFFAKDTAQGVLWANAGANAQKGYEVYKQQGWGAWEAKTSGAYLAYYPQAMTAAADLGTKTGMHGGDEKAFWQSLISKKLIDLTLTAAGVTGADIAAVANQGLGDAVAAGAAGVAQGTVDAGAASAAAVGDMAQVVTSWWNALTTPALWMRLAYGATGVVLVAGGLFLIVRSRPAVQQTAAAVGKVAGTVVPGAGAAAGVMGGKK